MADQNVTIGINANMNIGNVLNGVKQLQGAFNALKLPANLTANVYKEFDKLHKQLRDFQDLQNKTNLGKSDLKALDKLRNSIDSTYGHLIEEINELSSKKIILEADATKIKEAEATVKNLQQQIQNKLNTIDLKFEINKNNTLDIGLSSFVTQLESASGRSKQFKASLEEIKQAMASGDTNNLGAQIINAINQAQKLKGAGSDVLKIFSQMGIIKLDTKKLEDAEYRTKKFEQALKIISPVLQSLNADTGELKDKLAAAFEIRNTAFETGLKNGQNEIQKINTELDKSRGAADRAGAAFKDMANQTVRAADEVKQLQQSTQYFFSLRNMINLLRRGISDAVQTVKELDAAMTETAVVTDFSVGDMWAKLPEYTANANKLGATIQDMYESTTLYYQQGLNTEQSMAIASETMKMARIAGLEAKDATDMMTAALRGFNMELNEASATRINDVYSNLAAKTASDTEEIGKAMQRTASIAHSAGMSFEGTAAFLAQAVETTREPAENIGTAMKTIVARFQEMKKNPLEITEVDGEEVSYNKVDTALQSIGVSLKDANGQFRELDKVFLDISKKWDSLSQTQQRYIATIAAGSRQQSRFIAMMGDYDRTVELMSYANDSAGASQEQFNKTLDSLQAKINKFRNAWDEFLMGIMNDSWVKGLVDAGTTILGTVNKIIDALSFGGKAKGLQSLLSIGTAGIALKAGGNLLNKLIGGVGGFIDPSSSFGKGFWGAGRTTTEGTPATGLAGKITTPIVAKLNELIAVTKNTKERVKTTSTLDQYKNASNLLRGMRSSTMGTVGSLFNQLSDEHAYTAYKNAPGTVDAMKQSALGWLGSKHMPSDAQKTGQQLMDAIFKGMEKKEISVKDGIKLLGQPQKWGQLFGTDVAQNFSKAYIQNALPTIQQETARANQQALMNLGFTQENAAGMAVGSDALKAWLTDAEFAKQYAAEFAKIKQQFSLEGTLSNVAVQQTNYQNLANTVSVLGSKFSTAGMSLQMFGTQLGQLSPALQGVGALLSQIGMALNTFGMGISGIGSIVTKVGGRIAAGQAAVKYGSAAMAQAVASGAVAAESTVAATGTGAASAFMSGFTGGMSAGPVAAIIVGTLVGGIAIAKGAVDKKAREAGEEVRKNFEQGFTETNKKIDSITEYKDRFDELSKGVDQFGHNINLTDEEFDEYLTISRELQELSPSLISGYNAEGQAILRKGAALDEVISKLKEERDLSLQDYITDDSIGKLIGEYNTSDAYKNHNTIKMGDSGIGDAFGSEKIGISKALKEAEIEWSNFSQILDELGIGGAESINDLSNRQLSMISAHYTDILNKIKEFNPQIEEEAEDGLKEAFAETNNALDDVLTEGAPIVDALRQWMGQEKLDAVGLGLSEEFVSGFNSGLDGLMVEGLTNNWKPEEYKTQLRDYASEWEHLAGPTSTYTNILSEADKIQQQYLDHIGEDGAIENYENDVEGLATQLESLAEQYKGTGAAGEVFAEQCQQQASNLRNYATEGVVTLAEALNTLSDEFASARGAQERFQAATEGGDYYTAAEGYKSIIDTILDEKNTVGNGSDGSLTFWAGADELLGQQFVDSHTADEVVAQIEKIKGCFEDGLPGVQKFGDLLVENADKLEGLGKINEDTGQFEFDFKNLDDLEKYAELLGMSEDALAALIDKSRQYVSWNLSDPGKIRKAIEDSQYSMAGTSAKGESLVYTAESQFRAEARRQNIRGDDYTQTKSDAEERGVRFLNVENLTAKKGDGLYADQVLENIGLKGQDKTVENAVAAFTKMGLDLEDTKQVLMSDGIKLANGEEATAENIEKAYNEQAYAVENPTVAGIKDNTSILVSNTSAMLAAMGILTEDAKQEIDNATSKDTTQGYIDNLKNASNLGERNTARTAMEDKVSEYNALANKLIEAGRSETDPYVQKLRSAADALQTELNIEAENWNNKAVAANQYLKDNNIVPQNATQEEQTAIQMHAVDLQSAIETGDANTVIETLKQIETEGNLSIETMIALGQSVSNLGTVDSSSILHFISEYYEKLKLAKQESSQPFEIETKFTGEKLEDHISQIQEFTTQEYAFLIRADVSGDEKVSTLIKSINQEFGNGDEKAKTILIKAVAETASGDKEQAHNTLLEAFDEDTAETIEKKIDILCDGSVANKDDVYNALNTELEEINLKPNLTADATVAVNSLKTSGDTVHYSTEVDQSGLNAAKTTAAEGAKMPLTIEDKASADIRTIRSAAGKKVSFDVEPNFVGTWTKTLTIKKSNSIEHDARGRKYSIPASQIPSFGSAEKGMNIPKPKRTGSSRITALVGEKGFEVGYIPSERRSVIFGANGPEMTSFPNDTIIYPHEQSKKIVQRGKGNHKSLGSFELGNTGKSSGIPITTGSYSSVGKKLVDNAKKAGDSVSKTADNTAKAINRVLVWWDNAGRRATEIQRATDKNQKTYEKYLKEMQATLKSTGTVGQGDNFIANTQRLITEQQVQYNKAVSELSNLDLGGAAKTNKGRKNQYNAGADNIVQISYKKGKKTKTAYMNTADYIYQDANGAYQINQAALNSVKNADQRKALADALNKEINDRISKRNSAADAIEKAQEALEKFSEELYESFFAWETELTKIQNITQKIEALTNKIARKDAIEDLLNAQVKAGTDTPEALSAQLLQNFTNRLQDTQETIAKRRQLIDETALDLQNKATGKNIQDQIATVAKNLAVATNETERMGLQKALEKLQDDQKVFEAVQKYAKYTRNQDGTYSVDFDSAAFEQDKLAGKLSSEMGKAIQEFVKELEEGSKSLDDLYKTQREDLTKLYTTLNDLNDQWADYEKQLVEINEEANKKELDEVKKLSDSLKKSMDELLDEVKRKLEERRKIDDNRKTEQDISQKQQRLAALRADTSGGHQVEIAQLEKEIAEAQQNYQRSLEDQLLDKLQQQADIAERQRERQIEIQESLLSGVNNIEEVQKWMAAPEQYKNDILEQYRRSKGYYDEGVGEAQKAQIDREFASFFTDMLTNRNKKTSIMEAISDNEIETIKQKEADQLKLTNKETATKFDDARTQLENLDINKGNYTQAQSSLDSLRQQWGAMSSEARALTNFDSEQDIQQRINDAKSIYDQEEAARLEQERKNGEAAEAGEKQKIQNNYDKAIKDFQRGRYEHMHQYGFAVGSPTGDAASFYEKVLRPLGKQLGYGPKEILTTLADKMGWNELLPIVEEIYQKKSWLFDMDRLILTFQSSKDFQNAFNKSTEQKARLWYFSHPDMEDANPYYGGYGKKTNKKMTLFDIALQEALRKGLIPYKTGGLANYTGPAWLDGTPSKPELILNAKDTQNFIALKDVLSRALSSTSQTNSSYGNAVYEININVDHINNDYDVDKIAKRVKENIVKDSSYRNVTQVRKFR